MREPKVLEVDLLGLLELGEPTAEDRVMVEVIWGILTIIVSYLLWVSSRVA